MIKKGFTLIEAITGLALLGLISVMILPIISTSFMIFNNHKTKLEMMYLGETTVEKIKAFDINANSDVMIYDTEMSKIIDLFKSNEMVEITIPKKEKSEKYLIKILKQNKSNTLWMIHVYVYQNKEKESVSDVEYKAYLPPK